MRCSLKFLVSAAAIIITPFAVMAGQRTYPSVGAALTQAEIDKFDHIIGPEGQQLPPGKGTVKEGAKIFAQRCEVCHGKNGEDGISRHLVAGKPGKPYRGTFYNAEEKNGISYYPTPTLAWDYINRAMPATNPGSLNPDEVYALVAFLYYRNGIIRENEVMDAKTLPRVQMPNRDGFVPAKPVYPAEKAPSWW